MNIGSHTNAIRRCRCKYDKKNYNNDKFSPFIEYICYGYNLNNITGSLYRILIKNIRLFELFKILRKEIFSNDKGICF